MNKLLFINRCTIEIEGKCFSKLSLNLLHLSVIPERQVINCVCKIELMSAHIDLLDDLAERMR